MVNIAIIEDEENEQKKLVEYIRNYFNHDTNKFNITIFDRAEKLIMDYKPLFNLIFMDIELNGMDGMTAARKIREFDTGVVIIFVTNMAQYAVKGYEVAALDFVVKPVAYSDFYLKLQRVEKMLLSREDISITVSDRYKTHVISTNDLVYIEVVGHYLEYHTVNGILRGYGKIKDAETQLKTCDFLRCNSCYLVNPRYIKSVRGFSLFLKDGTELLISHAKKKQFMQDFCEWLGEGKHL